MRERFPSVEADEAIAETLIALVDVFSAYRYSPDETGRFHNYLTGILKHKALYRRKMAERHAKSVAAFEDSAKSADDSAALAEEQEWKETVFAIAVRQLLADETIHSRTKQIFQRVAVDGASPEEVAKAYGVSRNNVDQIKDRMIRKLQELVRGLESVNG